MLAGSAARVFAALTCGHEHVAAEAGRLLTRLWAPRAARRGGPTWTLIRAEPTALPDVDMSHLNSIEDPVIAKQAKSTCLGPSGRYSISLFLLLTVRLTVQSIGSMILRKIRCIL